jgi:hypothetical protein
VRDLSGFDEVEVEAEVCSTSGPASPGIAEFANGKCMTALMGVASGNGRGGGMHTSESEAGA